jgi:hypothetical protein
MKTLVLLLLSLASTAHANETSDALLRGIPASPRAPLPLPSRPQEPTLDFKNSLFFSGCSLVTFNFTSGEIIAREPKILDGAVVLGDARPDGEGRDEVLHTLQYRLPNGGVMFLKVKKAFEIVNQVQLDLAEVPGARTSGPERRTFMIRITNSGKPEIALMMETTSGTPRLMHFENDQQLECQYGFAG